MSARRRTALVAIAAVLGIAIAAAITWGTSQLVRQRIGLASEPLTVGRRLLPPAAKHAPARSTRPPGRSRTSNSTRTSAPAPSTTTSSTPTPIPSAPPVAVPEPTPESSPPASAPAESSSSRGGSARDGGGDSSSHRDD
jgi:hypothetical protein